MPRFTDSNGITWNYTFVDSNMNASIDTTGQNKKNIY